MEGWRNDLLISRGFAGEIAATLQVPWVGIGSPHWDAIAEDFHARVGLENMRRDWFPRGSPQCTCAGTARRSNVSQASRGQGSGT